jgi:hypothetical protein
MTVAPIAQDLILAIPFVTVPAFKAHPTFIDVQNLRSGSTVAGDQDAELLNILLMASEDAESICDQPIQAHVQVDSRRNWADNRGRLFLYPCHAPVRTVLAYSYASQLGQATSIANPLCQIEDGRQIIVELAGASGSWSGSLQFGAPPSSVELYTTCSYVAGYANAVLTAAPGGGAMSITVSNPTGIYAGDTLRIWEPGKEESVVVAPSWAGQATTPFTPAAIPLVAGLANAHPIGAGVTGFGADLHLATIYLAIDGLQRYGTSSSNWPGARVKSSIGKNPKDATPWQAKAMRLLRPYRAVR